MVTNSRYRNVFAVMMNIEHCHWQQNITNHYHYHYHNRHHSYTFDRMYDRVKPNREDGERERQTEEEEKKYKYKQMLLSYILTYTFLIKYNNIIWRSFSCTVTHSNEAIFRGGYTHTGFGNIRLHEYIKSICRLICRFFFLYFFVESFSFSAPPPKKNVFFFLVHFNLL